MKSYKELIVWQKGFRLTLLIYKITKKFPQNERYGLVPQMRRAAISIISNIAEGYGRKHRKEYIHFLSISLGSALELETQLLLSKELKHITNEEFISTNELLEEVLKMLNKLISKLY